MKISINEETGTKEFAIAGVISSVGTEVRETKGKKTPYRWAKVDIEYPNGKKARVDATLWEASNVKLPDSFKPGCVVELVTQLEGENAGYSKVGLPTVQKVDVSLFTFDAEVAAVEEKVEEVA